MRAVRQRFFLAGLLALLVVLGANTLPRSRNKSGNHVGQPASDPEINTARFGEGTGPETARGDASPVTSSANNVAARTFRWDVIQGDVVYKARSGTLISKEDAERFLREKGPTALNLLAVAAATGNEEFARRAAMMFPDDPAVQLTVLARDLFPTERAEWIARFQATTPDSPLPLIYSALEAFQRQDSATAVAQASSAIEQSGLYWWSSEFIQATQELYQSKGYTSLEAELLSAFAQPQPHLNDFQKLNADLLKWHKQALQDGNVAGAEEALRAAYGLGKLFQSPEGSRTLINQLFGIGIESRALSAAPADTQPSFLDVPRAQREAEISRFKEFVRDATMNTAIMMGKRDTALLAGYLQRCRDEGEYQAILWLKQQIK